MKRLVIAVSLATITALTAAEPAKKDKKECRLPGYDKANPTLAQLNLPETEKSRIRMFLRAGKKIEAVLVLRQCKSMSLAEQKKIVDGVDTSY